MNSDWLVATPASLCRLDGGEALTEGFSERLRRLAGPDWTGATAELLETALRHSSLLEGAEGEREDNERLEFLGDAVLGLVVAEALYQVRPPLDPGAMTRARAAVVAGPVLAEVAAGWGLGAELQLGRGESRHGGHANPSNLGRAMEAAIGAVYLGAGLEAAARVVLEALGDRIQGPAPAGLEVETDPKSALQELVQGRGHGQVPAYEVLGRSGPDHAPVWVVRARVGEATAQATGSSLRSAEKAAARELLLMLQWRGHQSHPEQERSPSA